MSKKTGMSTMGYAIVLVIILGIVMIISAPMLVDNYEMDKNKQAQEAQNSYQNDRHSSRDYNNYNQFQEETYINITKDMRNIERRLSSRIDELEMHYRDTSDPTSYDEEETLSDKYICEIEGVKNEYGNTVEITEDMDISTRKIVFVCEYRR